MSPFARAKLLNKIYKLGRDGQDFFILFMSIDTYEPTEDIVLEQEENSLNDFSVERMDYSYNERNLENNIDRENEEELMDAGENVTNIGQFVLDMRGGEPEDWKLTYQESGSKFDGKELFGQDGASLTEVIRNSDLSTDKILGHEDMLNHFRDNITEPYMLPDWIEQGADGEQIIHVTVASIDKEGNVSYETWTHQKEKQKEEEEDKEKDKNDNINLNVELEEVITIEEKEIVGISKIEENNSAQNEEGTDTILEVNNSINYNETIILNEEESINNTIVTNDSVYSSLEININNKEISRENNSSIPNNNELVFSINDISKENINKINDTVDNKEEISHNLQNNEVVVDKRIDQANENITEIKGINNSEERVIINDIKEEIEKVNVINNTETKNFMPDNIKFEEINEINNIEEIEVVNHTETKDILEHTNIITQIEVKNSVLEDIITLNKGKEILDEIKEETKEIKTEGEKNNISVSFEGGSMKESTIENFNLLDNIKNEEFTKSNIETVSSNINNNEKQNKIKEVELEKEVLNILNNKEIVQESKIKTLEEKIIDLFKHDEVDASKESKIEKENNIQTKETKEEVSTPTKTSSKEINISNVVSLDKKEPNPEISIKTNEQVKEVVVNKPISNDEKNLESNKDVIKVNSDNEKAIKDDLIRSKETKISGHEILMKTLGLSSRINNEGLRVVYSNINQYQKDEDDNKVLSSNKFAYKPSNLNGISLKIRA